MKKFNVLGGKVTLGGDVLPAENSLSHAALAVAALRRAEQAALVDKNKPEFFNAWDDLFRHLNHFHHEAYQSLNNT